MFIWDARMSPTTDFITEVLLSECDVEIWSSSCAQSGSEFVCEAPTKLWNSRFSRCISKLYQSEIANLLMVHFLTHWRGFYRFNVHGGRAEVWILQVVACILLKDMFKVHFCWWKIGRNVCSGLLISQLHICVTGRCNNGVHCGIWRDERLCLSAPQATTIGNVGLSKLLCSVRIKCYQTL